MLMVPCQYSSIVDGWQCQIVFDSYSCTIVDGFGGIFGDIWTEFDGAGHPSSSAVVPISSLPAPARGDIWDL